MATEPASTGPWKSRPVFVSSTFADMQAERDHLRNVVFPRLEEELRKRRHQFEPIDLRIGVLTADLPDEAARELHVLKVCLDEIERSRPFLIVLLGDRYGWVPAPERLQAAAQEKGYTGELEGKSVTALEIEFGLIKSDAAQRQRSFIYLRDPLPYEQMAPALAGTYSDAHAADAQAPQRAANLRALKQRLTDDPELKGRTFRYRAQWDAAPPRPHVTGLETWGNMVFDDLWTELEAETAAHASAPAQSWQEEERLALRDFIDERRRDFTGREQLLSELKDALTRNAPSDQPQNAPPGLRGVCVTGAPGSGKSALWAELQHRLQADTSLLILANAAGATARGAQVDSMLRRFIGELADALGSTNPLADDAGPDDVENSFYDLLNHAAQQRRVLLMLDALDQFEPSARAQQLSWLRAARWPANARLFATAQPVATGAQVLAGHPSIQMRELPALQPVDIAGIATRVWARYHRALDPQVQAVLASKQLPDGSAAAGNPLWLTLALEQINLLDADDFARAERDYSHLPPAERLRALMVDTANRMPPAVQELYGWLLDATERAYGQVQARSFAVAIALSRFGWRESDLMGIVPRIGKRLFPPQPEEAMSDLAVATLRRGFRAHLIRRGAAGQLDFLHAQMRQAVLQRVAADDAKRRTLHAAINDHLETLAENDPIIIAERMGHLLGEQDALRAARYYATLDASKADPTQRTGSTWALVEWLTTAPSPDETVARPAWLCGWLAQPELTGQEQGRLADNFAFGLAGPMAPLLVTAILAPLMRATLQTRQRLVDRDPTNNTAQRELSVSNFKIGDILRAQGDLPGALKALQGGMGITERLARLDPGNSQWQCDLAASHERIGGILQAQGDLLGALKACQAGMVIAERLARLDPGNSQWQRDLSVSQMNIGAILKAQGDLPGALKAFQAGMAIRERLARLDPVNSAWQRDLTDAHINIGSIQEVQGDAAGALTAFHASMVIAERLARLDPGNSGWQRDLSVSHMRIGGILQAQGDLAGALKAFQAGMAIFERLAQLDPSNSEWQRDVSGSHDRIGHILQAQGDLPGAFTAFQAGMSIAERLAQLDPGNSQRQRGLSVAHDKIGDILQAQGDLAGAMKAYQSGMGIAERLARLDPGNSQWQRDLSASQDRIGAILQAQGDLAGALKAYQSGTVIRERLARTDPSNIEWQCDMAVSHDRIGGILQAQGDLTGALKAFQACMLIAERLARLDPGNSDWQRNLLASHDRIGVILQAQGDLAGALKAFQAGMAIHERLARLHSGNSNWQRNLSLSHMRIGDIQQAQGDTAGAFTAFQAGMAIFERLARLDPGNSGWQRDLSVSHMRIGGILQAQGDLAGALKAFQAGMAIFERLAELDPSNSEWQRDLSGSHDRIGYILQAQGDLPGAFTAFQAGMAIAERLAQLDPGNSQWQRGLSVAHDNIGDILQAQGDLAGALKAYQSGMAIRERLARLDPGNSQWQRDLVSSHTGLYAVANAMGQGALAQWHLVQCARTLHGMRHGGMSLDPALQQLQQQLDANGIRADDPIGAGGPPATAPNAKPGGPRAAQHDAPRSPPSPQPADPENPAAQAARANIAYQRALADWRALPMWKRLTKKKPEPPSGI